MFYQDINLYSVTLFRYSSTSPFKIRSAYAATTDNAELAADIINWVGAEPNEPLTLDDLREIDAPVWCSCKPIEGGNGYWCLCRYGYITTPGRTFFEVGKIPHWVFYRRPPEGEADA